MIDDPTIHILKDAAERYHAMSRAFERAFGAASAGRTELSLSMSGVPTRLRVAGGALGKRLIRPLRHLVYDEPKKPGLQIDLWDETETGITCPGCAIDESISTWGDWKCSPDGRFAIHHRRTALEMYDRQEQRIVGWSVGPLHVSHHERGRPLLRILMQWHRDNGLNLIHGGLVASEGFGVLFVGKGGSGKSTTALMCALNGMDFLSEDFLAIGPSPDGSHIGYSIFASAKLHPDHLLRFPRLRNVALGPEHAEDDKSLLFLEDLPDVRVANQVRIGAVVAPRVVDAPTSRVIRISRGEALMQLAPSTLVLMNCYGLGLRRGDVVLKNLDEFGKLLDTCPCYRLELGRDINSVAPAVRRIIDESRTASALQPSQALS
jgi:hypothetical protein